MTVAAGRARGRQARIMGPPGMAAWTALPVRDQRLIAWLWAGDVVNAELAALLAYGNLRVAQRRLARLVEYGIVRGFWAANRQRPRGRYAYALTKAAKRDLEYLLFAGHLPEPRLGQLEAPSPVIHQLATHDLLAAFLRASPRTDDIGLAAWVPEHAAALPYDGVLRPDAIALVRRGELGTALVIERDLGSERHEILLDKLRRYERMGVVQPPATNLGFIVESARRAGALRVSLRRAMERSGGYRDEGVDCWVTVGAELVNDPFGASWRSPDEREASVLTMPAIEPPEPMPVLAVPALLDDAAVGALDDRALRRIGWRGR